jgi:hypothetical protein
MKCSSCDRNNQIAAIGTVTHRWDMYPLEMVWCSPLLDVILPTLAVYRPHKAVISNAPKRRRGLTKLYCRLGPTQATLLCICVQSGSPTPRISLTRAQLPPSLARLKAGPTMRAPTSWPPGLKLFGSHSLNPATLTTSGLIPQSQHIETGSSCKVCQAKHEGNLLCSHIVAVVATCCEVLSACNTVFNVLAKKA